MARIDRWTVIPAVAAAVFTMVAIAPPGGAPAPGLRVEVSGERVAGRPLLVRVAVDAGGSAGWRAPRAAAVRVRDAAGGVAAGEARGAEGAAFAYGAVAPRGPGPYVLDASAEGLAAHATLRTRAGCGAGACVPVPPAVGSEPPLPPGGVEVLVEGGALVSEVPGTVLVRAPDAAGEPVAVEAASEGLRMAPLRATLDACGLAAFEARVDGMGAEAALRVGSPPGRVLHRRLGVSPGGVSVRPSARGVEVMTAAGGQVVYLLAGDARGPTYWSALRLPVVDEGYARAEPEFPAGAGWVLASLSPALAPAVGLWLAPPGAPRCDTPAGLGSRVARALAPLPEPPGVDVAYDGAAVNARARDERRARVRRAALALAGLAIAVLVALVLRAGLRADPSALREVASPRERAWIALASAGALVVGALVLLSAFLLRT